MFGIQLLNHIDGDDAIDRLVVLMREFEISDCRDVSAKLKLSSAEKKEFLFKHSLMGHLPDDYESSLRVYAVAVGEWCYQHLRIEKLFSEHENALSYNQFEVQNLLDRILKLKVDFRVQPLANGEYIMQQTNVPHGPKLGKLKSWLFYEQVSRNLQSIEEIDTLLCTLSWQTEDTSRWPKLQFP